MSKPIEEMEVGEMLDFLVDTTLKLPHQERPSFVKYCMTNFTVHENPIARSIAKEFEHRLVINNIIAKPT